MKCRNCNKTFNFITKALLYDEATGSSKSCLKSNLATFAQTYHSALQQAPLPTREDIQAVADQALALGLEPRDAFQHMQQESIDLLKRAFVISKEGDIITPEEEEYLHMLQRELHVPPDYYAAIQAEVRYIKLIQQIRSGDLPTVRPSVILPSTEIC